MGHARALLGLEEPKQMETLRNEIVKQDLTVRQTESRVNKLKKGVLDKPITQKVNKDIFIKDLEKDLSFTIKEDTVENLSESIQKLDDQMYIFAKQMEFEKAALCRDKIKYLKRQLIDL